MIARAVNDRRLGPFAWRCSAATLLGLLVAATAWAQTGLPAATPSSPGASLPTATTAADPDAQRRLALRLVEMIKTMLYGAEGERAAAAQGRRVWYDEASGEIHVVDTPENQRRVSRFLNSLPEFEPGRNRLEEIFEPAPAAPARPARPPAAGAASGGDTRQRVLNLRHVPAERMAGSLAQVLNLSGAGAGMAAAATPRLVSLNRGGQTQIGPYSIRLVRVLPNNLTDPYDDTAELSILSPAGVSTLTLRELESQILQDLLITAEVIRASGTFGQGRATLRIQLR